MLSHKGLMVLKPSHGVTIPAVLITSSNNASPNNPWYDPNDPPVAQSEELSDYINAMYPRYPELQEAREEREAFEERISQRSAPRRMELRKQAERVAAGRNRKRLVIMFSHSNGETLAIKLLWLCHLQLELNGLLLPCGDIMEISVFSFEYAGFSIAARGVCCTSERSIYADISAAYTCLTQELGIPPSEILLFGRSIGSGPICELGFRHPEQMAGVILESPFCSAFTVVNENVATRCLCCCDVFKNIDKVGAIQCPVLFIHGTEDRIVPVEHSVALHAQTQAQYEPYWAEGAGHNDVAERREYHWRSYEDKCKAEGLSNGEERQLQADVYEQMQESEQHYFQVIANFTIHILDEPRLWKRPMAPPGTTLEPEDTPSPCNQCGLLQELNTMRQAQGQPALAASGDAIPGCVPENGPEEEGIEMQGEPAGNSTTVQAYPYQTTRAPSGVPSVVVGKEEVEVGYESPSYLVPFDMEHTDTNDTNYTSSRTTSAMTLPGLTTMTKVSTESIETQELEDS